MATAVSASIETVRKKIKEFKPKVKQLDSLADVKLVSPAVIEVGKQSIPMTRIAVRGLCDQLDVPATWYNKLFRKDKQTWSRVTNLLAEKQTKPVVLVASNNYVIAVVNKLTDLSRHDEVLNIIERLLRLDKSLMMRYVEFNGVDLNIHLLHKSEINTGEWFGAQDYFRFGATVQNNLVEGFSAERAIERMVCTNLSYSEIPGTASECSSVDKLPQFLENIDRNEIMQLIKERVGLLREHCASLREVMRVGSMLISLGDSDRPFVKEYVNQLRIGEIAFAYRMQEDQLREQPELWRATVKTPFNLYDLFNWLTYIARHEQRLAQDESNELRFKGGRMLFDSPDLASVAPARIISRQPWILSQN